MSKNKENTGTEDINFEAAMAELEALVAQMEEGDLSLDDSLKAFERGVMLTRQCQQALSQAELRVQALTDANTLEDLTHEDSRPPPLTPPTPPSRSPSTACYPSTPPSLSPWWTPCATRFWAGVNACVR